MKKETKISYVEMVFSNGLHIRILLGGLHRAVLWNETRTGYMLNITEISTEELIEQLKKVREENAIQI